LWNEITAIPKLLALLDLHGCIVTIDAMGCQRALAERIVEQGGDYVLGLKGNQGSLHEAVEEYFTIAQATDFKNVPYSYTEEVDNEHGRLEIRRYWITEDLGTLPRKARDKKPCRPRGRRNEKKNNFLVRLYLRIATTHGLSCTGIIARAANDLISAATAYDPVVAAITVKLIVTSTASDPVTAATAYDPIIAGITIELVIARAATDEVVTAFAIDGIATAKAEDSIVS